MEHEEYTAENYPSFGKKYNGEKAIISLTSWKARINTVSKTLFSLIKQCPGFHIVLVLSEEEFPKMMDELPDNLKLFVDNELIEVLWVYKNYKSFKKVLFTMDKYRTVPIISADDDCIYTCNYAQMLYDEWVKHNNCVITMGEGYKRQNVLRCNNPTGSKCLYPPNVFNGIAFRFLTKKIISTNNDDGFYGYLLHKTKRASIINPFPVNKRNVYIFHDEFSALHDSPAYKTKEVWTTIKKVIDENNM